MYIDLSFMLESPAEASAAGTLTIRPLAPLSMNQSVPGKHIQTEIAPPLRQVYGMIENAFGLHFGWKGKAFGYKLRRTLARAAAADVSVSGLRKAEFQSVLAPYYELTLIDTPSTATYDDTQWAHKWRDTAQARASITHQDWRARGDRPDRYGYGKTPIQREYVVADGPWRYRVQTTPGAGAALRDALHAPKGPLYLGTSDGWVDAAFDLEAPRDA